MSNIAFCFDLDSTLTKEEILPVLARKIGLTEEINALTIATLQGVIPFEGSFRLRCKLLKDIPISMINQCTKDILLFEKIVSFIKKNSNNCFIITGNLDIWLKDLLSRIPCKFFSTTANYIGDQLINVQNIINKADIVKKIKKDYSKVITIGDGMGDVSMFRTADIKVAYAAVHKPPLALLNLSNYVSFSEDSLCNLLNTLL